MSSSFKYKLVEDEDVSNSYMIPSSRKRRDVETDPRIRDSNEKTDSISFHGDVR